MVSKLLIHFLMVPSRLVPMWFLGFNGVSLVVTVPMVSTAIGTVTSRWLAKCF